MDNLEQVLFSENEYSSDHLRLIGNGCRVCRNAFFPKREFCPSCLQTDAMEDFLIPEYGKLYTFTEIYVAPKKFKPPYLVGYVDIDEQLRLFGHIHTSNSSQPKISQTMKIKLGPIGEEDGKILIGVILEPRDEN